MGNGFPGRFPSGQVCREIPSHIYREAELHSLEHLLQGVYCGLYITTIAGDEFWKKEPGRYPNKYYNFSTKMRPYIFVGQRFGFSPRHDLVRHVSLFYELSTCELYLISKVTNKSLSMRDILRLSFGVKVQLFRDE